MMARTSKTSKSTKKEEVSNDVNSYDKIPPKRTTSTSSFIQSMRNNLSKRQNVEEDSINSSNSSKKPRTELNSNSHTIDPHVLL